MSAVPPTSTSPVAIHNDGSTSIPADPFAQILDAQSVAAYVFAVSKPVKLIWVFA